MPFEDIDCVNPAPVKLDALPPKGVRLRPGKMTRKGGGDPTRYIRLTIGKDLARAASLTLPVHKLRLLFGTGDDAGKIMVAVDQERGRFSAKRSKAGDYALTINAASAEGLFALEFPVFCVIDVAVDRAPHCPASFTFTASADMLAVAD